MALTKNDIENAVNGNPYEREIRHSLSNYFEDLSEPVAVAITIRSDKGSVEDIRDFSPTHVHKLVNSLREKGIDAVSFLDSQAADPSKFVVNQNGVLCPFMNPEDALKATILIETLAKDQGYNIVGHANPLSEKNLLYVSGHKMKTNRDQHIIDVKGAHPDQAKFEALETTYGNYKDFINKKINEAYASSEQVNFDDIDRKNVYENGGEFLFRGGSLGANPYAVISEFNSRKVAHSSSAASISAGYSGKDRNASTLGGAVYDQTESGIGYGFIYKFHSLGDDQKYYANVGLETGYNPHKFNDALNSVHPTPWAPRGPIYEAPVLPHHNKLASIYVHLGDPSENRLFEVPLDENGQIKDPEWRAFFEMHEPSDDKVVGYLAQRQNAQKREQGQNSHNAYRLELHNNLQPDTQEYLKTVSAKEFAACFIRQNSIEEKDNGQIQVDGPLDLTNLEMVTLPSLNNVQINGRFSINTFQTVKASQLPQTTGGIFFPMGKVTDTAEVSAEHFAKIIGAKEINGWYTCQGNNNLQCDGIPQGWEHLKFESLPDVKMEYDRFEQIPETRNGINFAEIKLKDQSTIQNMSAEAFLYKIKGNVGTRTFPPALDSEEFTPIEKNNDIELNLSRTNITVMPKGLDAYTLKSVMLNDQEVVTSLDNFPVTQKGIYNLNFDGDLKNETMLSFLNKTKGTEWVGQNTSTGTDGRLIIHGDLDFCSNSLSEDKAKFSVKSMPKDFDNVLIKGKIKPDQVASFARDREAVMRQIDDSHVSVKLSSLNDIPLEKFQCTSLKLSGNGEFGAKLPPNLKEIRIEDNKALATLPKLNDNCKRLSFANSSMQGGIHIPSQINSINIENCNLISPANMNSNAEQSRGGMNNSETLDFGKCKEVCLQNFQLPKGAILDLSQCQRVVLSDMDFSQVQVKLPQTGSIEMLKNVTFPADYQLDLSKCKEAYVDKTVKSGPIKLPEKHLNNDVRNVELPPQIKEIPASYICSCKGKIKLPENIKIIDNRNEQGKKFKISELKQHGLSQTQCKTLRKERLMAPFQKMFDKFKKQEMPKRASEKIPPLPKE